MYERAFYHEFLMFLKIGTVSMKFKTLTCPSSDDTIGDLKKLIAAQTGTRPEKIVLKKWQV